MHLHGARRERFNPRGDIPQDPPNRIEIADIAIRQQQSARDRIVLVQPSQQLLDLCRILALAVVEQHVAPEVRISAQDLVRAFAGDHNLVAGIAHRFAQQKLRHSMRVHAERLRLQNRIRKILSQMILVDRNWIELSPRQRSHLPRNRSFIVGSIVESQRESANRIGMVTRSQTQHRAGVQPAAQINTHRHVGTQTDAHRLFQLVAKLGGIIGVRPLRRGIARSRIVEVPVARDLKMLLRRNQVVPRRHKVHAIVKRAHLVAAKSERLVDAFLIPSRRNACGKQRLHLRRNVERVVVPGIEKRLDAESIARGK